MRITISFLGLLLASSRAGLGDCSSFRAAQPWHPHLARVQAAGGAADLSRRAPEAPEGVPSLLQLGSGGPGCDCEGQQRAAAPLGQQGFLQPGPGFPAVPDYAQAVPAGAAAPQPAQEEGVPAFVPMPFAGAALSAAPPGTPQYDQAAASAYASQPPPPYVGEGLGQQGELTQEEALAQRQEVLQLQQQVGLMEHRMEQMEAAASRQSSQEALERTLPPQSAFQARLPMLRPANGEARLAQFGQLQQTLAAQGQQLAPFAGAPQAAAVPAGLPLAQMQQVPVALGAPAPPFGTPMVMQPAYAAAVEQQWLQQAAYEQQRQALQVQQLAEQEALAQAMPQAMPQTMPQTMPQAMPQAQLLEPWGGQQGQPEAVPATVPFVLR
mmetsp:Transcript_98854/g.257687  ORF Transcript_98854/g.257687 Transcript_98854/m.257687 type:complete len:381 (+) Transcript_98854:160-1302(+)